jgi:hypothetical protein
MKAILVKSKAVRMMAVVGSPHLWIVPRTWASRVLVAITNLHQQGSAVPFV